MYIIMNNILKKFRQFLLQISSQLKSKVEEYAMTSEIEFIFMEQIFHFFPFFNYQVLSSSTFVMLHQNCLFWKF